MSREGVTHDQLTRGEPSAALNNVVYEVASTAKVRLQVHDKHLQVIQLVLVDDVLALQMSVCTGTVQLCLAWRDADNVLCRLCHELVGLALLGTVLEKTACGRCRLTWMKLGQ